MKPYPKASRPVESNKKQDHPIAFDWESIEGYPIDVQYKIRDIAELAIETEFRECIPQPLRDTCDAPAEQNPELYEQFNEFLITQAPQIGTRLLLSNSVVVRLMRWSHGAKGGICYLEKFTKALVQYAKVRMDVDNARGDIRWRDFHAMRNEATRELAALQKEIRKNDVNRRGRPGLAEIETTIRRSAASYPWLSQNLTALLTFCRQRPAERDCFLEGITKPAPFFYELIAWGTHRDPESVRQKISGRK